jgi:fermentation-respiration switch protein FrsA (DUF1100 family)
LRVPVLLFQGDADTVVPASLATLFADARRDLVDYVLVLSADHVSSSDVNPARYWRALTGFLRCYP